MGWSEDNPTEGADSTILRNKCTTVFVPQKSSDPNSYTFMVQNEKKKEKTPSLRYVSLFSLVIIIGWLTFLTLKVEEKSMVASSHTDLELSEIMKAKIMAEDEARAMQKIIEHYAQDGNVTSIDIEREERAVLQVISGVFSGLSMICSAGKVLHQMVADAGVGVYGRWHKQIKKYQEDIQLYKEQIMCKQNYVEEINERIMKTLKAYQHSKVRANSVRETYSTILLGMKEFEDGLKDPQKVNATTKKIAQVRAMMLVDIQDVGVRWRDSYLEDLVFLMEDVLALTFTGWGGNALEWAWKGITGNAGNALDFAGIASGLSIVKSIVKIWRCIQGHINIVGEKKEELDETKKQHDLVKDAYGQLANTLESLDNQTELMNRKIDNLSNYANQMFKMFRTNCTSTSATVLSDLEEIDGFVIHLKQNFDLKVGIELALKYIDDSIEFELQEEKEFLEEDGDTMTAAEEKKFIKRKQKMLVRSQYRALKRQHPKIEPDILIDKMKALGFEFPFKWSEWTVISDDQSCLCESSLSQCDVTKKRTCTSGRCLGPDEKTYNRCEKDKFQFFTQCKSRDLPMVGSCVSPDNAKVESGDLAGQYVSAGVRWGQCYKDCKATPGVLGCEYLKTSCSPVQGCVGECFAVTEDIQSGDKIPDVTCYKFKEPTKGVSALPVLQQVFDATEQMMTGRNFDTVSFREMYLYLMKVDKNIIEAQENAWQQMVKYQSTGLKDKWGRNPSDYQERDKRSLSIQNTETAIFEPCNFASNWAYYHLAVATRKLRWIEREKPDIMKALVQTSTGLAFASSFFHGSHTVLGQLLDNHMIKIMAYILYQNHIETSGITDPVLTDLVPNGRRGMTGVQMAEYMTDVFKNLPATEWTKKVEKMDVPSYEKSFSALILTLLEQMEITGPITLFVTSNIMSSMGVSKEEIRFLKEEFQPKLKARVIEWNNKNSEFWKKPDTFNTLAALIRTLSAFPFQENMHLGQGFIQFSNWVIGAINEVSISKKLHSPLDQLNTNLDHFSTLPVIEPVKLGRRDICPFEARHLPVTTMELFPGYEQCKNNKATKHSLWHAQSARGILDFFKLADEFIRKQTDHLNPKTPPPFDDIAEEAKKIGTETMEGVLNVGKNIGENIAKQTEDVLNKGAELGNGIVGAIGEEKVRMVQSGTKMMNNFQRTSENMVSDLGSMFG